MVKNLVIISLVIVIDILIGIIIVTNYNWFTQEWSIGIGMVVGGIIIAGLLGYFKVRRK
ncbi:hypothetical protein [Candidatus Nitrosarchaeum limnium]|uniref:Uncharacterized protein n=1 Tax=Candidatus Nitrosarchaeum limnium BG20 TaxID=859192 RepID=S2EKF7_9ARCH|nr:hypothetical protein [Candidatus Nitrosarchaeum limnium]EPA05137.1 hypothetical protein BG20_I1120 [Candidatus Nitrosarchaeum limnium BG20]